MKITTMANTVKRLFSRHYQSCGPEQERNFAHM